MEQVLVRVKASALNIEDIMVGAGERPGITLKPTKVSFLIHIFRGPHIYM